MVHVKHTKVHLVTDVGRVVWCHRVRQLTVDEYCVPRLKEELSRTSLHLWSTSLPYVFPRWLPRIHFVGCMQGFVTPDVTAGVYTQVADVFLHLLAEAYSQQKREGRTLVYICTVHVPWHLSYIYAVHAAARLREAQCALGLGLCLHLSHPYEPMCQRPHRALVQQIKDVHVLGCQTESRTRVRLSSFRFQLSQVVVDGTQCFLDQLVVHCSLHV
mmetsp:Transcript_4894/g.31337  ORF Transcript_4894/g.31337 Transcript_4894/m.31337 type:complete len:215 (-) Transcript_4894:252-896(-)